MPSREISPRRFEELVAQALDALPDEWLEQIDNVVVQVEDEPSADDLRAVGLGRGNDLLGLYQGVPLGERGFDLAPLPDRIVIYRGPTLRAARNRHEVVQIIRETVLHELGHHFGLEEDELPF